MDEYEITSITIATIAIIISVASTLYSGYQFHKNIQRDKKKVSIKAVYEFNISVRDKLSSLNRNIDSHIRSDNKFIQNNDIDIHNITPTDRFTYQVQKMSNVTDQLITMVFTINNWFILISYKDMVNNGILRNELREPLKSIHIQCQLVEERLNKLYDISGYKHLMSQWLDIHK